MIKRPKFTSEQMDYIWHQINVWYLNWKKNITVDPNALHRLGFAKEQLKELICGDGSIEEDYAGFKIHLYNDTPNKWRFTIRETITGVILHTDTKLYKSEKEALSKATNLIDEWGF